MLEIKEASSKKCCQGSLLVFLSPFSAHLSEFCLFFLFVVIVCYVFWWMTVPGEKKNEREKKKDKKREYRSELNKVISW